MTTEREMLEYAAKACGLFDRGEWFDTTDGPVFVIGNKPFNPKDNSADCAAMCAKLEIDTFWRKTAVSCSQRGRIGVCTILHNGTQEEKKTAWRSAATMVAAKIGGMK